MRLIKKQEGMALVTVMLVTMVVGLLALISAALADRSATFSGQGRNRVLGVHAAEAGVNEALKQMSTASGATWCGVAPGATTRLPGGGNAPSGEQFEVQVSDSNAADGPCTANDPRRLIRSIGYSPSATAAIREQRVMEADVRLVPKIAGPAGASFDKAIFSNSIVYDLLIHNSTKIYGNGGNNADVYANEDIRLRNSDVVHGDVIGQATLIAENQAEVFGDLWVKGDIRLENAVKIHGNVTSATGSITFTNNVTVDGVARAATTISLGNSWSVGGDTTTPCGPCYPSSPSSPPPMELLPTFTWNPNDPWPQPVANYTSCSTFMTYISNNRTNFRGTHRVSSMCGLLFANGWDVTLTGDAAIVADGWFDFNNSSKFLGGKALSLVSLCRPPGQPNACPDPEYGVDMRNSSDFSGVKLFVFANNKVTKRNSTTITGQIYANQVRIDNSFELYFSKVSVPGFSVTSGGGGGAAPPIGYITQVLYLREI